MVGDWFLLALDKDKFVGYEPQCMKAEVDFVGVFGKDELDIGKECKDNCPMFNNMKK